MKVAVRVNGVGAAVAARLSALRQRVADVAAARLAEAAGSKPGADSRHGGATAR